jgi:hypothetical protein
MNIFAALSSYKDGDAMNERREQLKTKLEQTRRLAAEVSDRITRDRLAEMVAELEEKLREAPNG